MMTTNHIRRSLLAAAATLGLAAAVVGCSDDATSAVAANSVTLTDSWAKAADGGMTAAFGTLVNDGDAPVTLTAVAADVSGRAELHEMASDGAGSMSMRQKEGGFEVPAHGERVLEPGGEHVMLMDVTAPMRAGDTLALTLTFADGSSADVEVPIRDFTGAQENYSEHTGE
ncbi:copper chaperone PCu(A)C [Rhodococcus gannanensis]|uniref:Copper chaperone PCu(A)C n=1 Tax=Rhodococcus gannanensis TaxID=1960308 RepID=A0ABW4NZ69_9NOCA